MRASIFSFVIWSSWYNRYFRRTIFKIKVGGYRLFRKSRNFKKISVNWIYSWPISNIGSFTSPNDSTHLLQQSTFYRFKIGSAVLELWPFFENMSFLAIFLSKASYPTGLKFKIWTRKILLVYSDSISNSMYRVEKSASKKQYLVS